MVWKEDSVLMDFFCVCGEGQDIINIIRTNSSYLIFHCGT